MMKWSLLSTILIVLLVKCIQCKYKRVCYITPDHSPLDSMEGSIFDKGNLLQTYEKDFCTHINIIPILADASNCSLSVKNEQNLRTIREIQKLRKGNPDLKILACVVDFGKNAMANISSSEESRKKFAKNAIEFMKKHNFDGLDLDWEFPVWTTTRWEERHNFILFLEELFHSFKKETKKYLLTAAVAGDWTIIKPAYDVPPMNKYLDHMNLMTYAFNGWHWFYPFTGHNAPLYASKLDNPYRSRVTTSYASQLFAKLGMSKDKIIVGIPTYSHTFRLMYSFLHGVHAPAKSEDIETSFAEVCRFLKQTGSHRSWDELAKVPYAYNDTIWISYEDNKSAQLKAEWIRDHGFGGVMTYNLNNDDYEGICSEDGETFPLHRIFRKVLPWLRSTSSNA